MTEFDEFKNFHAHRVTRLLEDVAPAENGKLCVLGAGPCNDLFLNRLLESWQTIELVDHTPTRIDEALEFQGVSRDRVRITALDLLWGTQGVPNLQFDDLEDEAIRRHEVQAASAKSGEIGLVRWSQARWEPLEESFDGIASTCLLSQLILQVKSWMGNDHPELVEAIKLVRWRHFMLMAKSLCSGGTGLLVCDFVSSDTLPQLMDVDSRALPSLLKHALETDNFFHGLNPGILLKVAREDVSLQAMMKNVGLSNPWVWYTGDKAYAVVAIRFQRAG